MTSTNMLSASTRYLAAMLVAAAFIISPLAPAFAEDGDMMTLPGDTTGADASVGGEGSESDSGSADMPGDNPSGDTEGDTVLDAGLGNQDQALESASVSLMLVTGTWYVNDDASGADDGTSPTDAFDTIQEAVNAADPGDLIIVDEGTYAEHVAINKSVTLQGFQASNDARAARTGESTVNGGGTDAPFAVQADNVTIDGFTVTGGQNNLGAGIWSGDAENLQILNNIITDNSIGIWADCGGNCLIENNLFDGNNRPGASGGAAISADSTVGLTINENVFTNHTSNNPLLFQVVAAGDHQDVAVTGNVFENNEYGVFVLGVNGGLFDGNTITLATTDGTGFSFGGGNTDITVSNNILNGMDRGIRVTDFGYGLGDNENIVVIHNQLDSNAEYGVGVLGGYVGQLDATENWWGEPSGPATSTNPSTGTGSSIEGDVAYNPWCIVADCSLLNTDDDEAPEITVIGDTSVTVQENDPYTDAGATATDNVDSQVDVVASGDVIDTSTPGTYTVTYTATDAQGNVGTATRTVTVENEEPTRRSSGGGGRSSNSNPDNDNGGEVLGESTNDGGQTTNGEVLGESDFVFTVDLTVGSTGNDVIELQKFLIAQGYLKIAAPTGYFGPLTKAAVAAYQAANGIYPAVGYFGPITRAKVNSL